MRKSRQHKEPPMSKFPWKTTFAGAAFLAVAGYAIAAQLPPGGGMHGPMMMQGPGGMNGHMAQMHQQMMQGQGMHGAMQGGGMGMHGMGQQSSMHGQRFGAGAPTMPGQDAFGTIQEIVQMLEADPSTDWSKVSIAPLREHLIDMNEVTLNAAASETSIDGGIEISVTGQGRTLDAIKRMVPAHAKELRSLGWNVSTEDLPHGVKLTVLANGMTTLAKLKALGFMGIMVQGAHHQPHHLMMAKGDMPVH
jgi:hypothetical protein